MPAVLIAAAAIVLSAPAMAPAQQQTDPARIIGDYLDRPHDEYGWELLAGAEVQGIECSELRMTSQRWQETEWRHQLFFARPGGAPESSQAVLIISGGTRHDLGPESRLERGEVPQECRLLAQAAKLAGQPVAMLKQVPFQPMFGGLTEDDLISHTFDEFLDDPSREHVPLLVPMVRAAVGGMDAVHEFGEQHYGMDLTGFTVTGTSKRGWTTWLTAAHDDRVRALAPAVFDILNMGPQLRHQVDSWGSYSEQISEYSEKGLTEIADTPEGKKLIGIVDPYNYRDRITRPKLIVLGTRDPYWPLDALNLYWDGLQGEKRALYVPNAGHGAGSTERAYRSIAALARASAGEFELPGPEWSYDESEHGVTLRIDPGENVQTVRLWRAGSEDRDFRQAGFTSDELSAGPDGEYAVRVSRASDGYRALYGEIEYELDGQSFSLSTRVRILEPGGG